MPLSAAYATVTFSEPSFSVRPGETHRVSVNIAAPAGVDASTYPVFSGFIQIASATESLQVTYMGLAASLKDKQVVDNTDGYFGVRTPALLDGAGDVQANTTNYTFVGTDYPTLLFRCVSSEATHSTVPEGAADWRSAPRCCVSTSSTKTSTSPRR